MVTTETILRVEEIIRQLNIVSITDREKEWLRNYIEIITKQSNSDTAVVIRKPTEIKDKHGNMICFGDKVRFADKVEWYKGEYWSKVMLGIMTKDEALKEIDGLPYEERIVENVHDYEWLLSSEIQIYWELTV